MGRIKYPALHDQECLIGLVESFGTAKRIAEHVDCNRSAVCGALVKAGIWGAVCGDTGERDDIGIGRGTNAESRESGSSL